MLLFVAMPIVEAVYQIIQTKSIQNPYVCDAYAIIKASDKEMAPAVLMHPEARTTKGLASPLPPVCNAPPCRRYAGPGAGDRAGTGLAVRHSCSAHGTTCKQTCSAKFARNDSKTTHLGDAPLLVVLLHWVQLLRRRGGRRRTR